MWVPSLRHMIRICPSCQVSSPVLAAPPLAPFATGFLCRTPCELKKLAYCPSIGLARMSPSNAANVACQNEISVHCISKTSIHDSEIHPFFCRKTPKKQSQVIEIDHF